MRPRQGEHERVGHHLRASCVLCSAGQQNRVTILSPAGEELVTYPVCDGCMSRFQNAVRAQSKFEGCRLLIEPQFAF